MSISCDSTEDRTPPRTPVAVNTEGLGHARSESMIPHPGTPTAERTGLTEAERKAINILVVEDNSVNQQIAIKTIKKLGFSANAVWNGQEALQYLEQDASENRPNPDIVLMDVQMPILDGYKATRILRSQEPYQSKPGLRNIPVIAMTASAIQGDREKCQKAGMDDYLAKPVKGKILEKMLVKWAIEGKRKQTQIEREGSLKRPHPLRGLSDTTISSGEEQHNPTLSLQKQRGLSSNSVRMNDKPPDGVDNKLYRINFDAKATLETSTSDESQRSLQRQDAEEKAASLRDDKLLQSSEDPRLLHRTSGTTQQREEQKAMRLDNTGPRHALTQENVQRLVTKKGMPEKKDVPSDQRERQDSSSSMDVQAQEESGSGTAGRAGQTDLRVGDDSRSKTTLRPPLEKQRNDSERTITRSH